MDLNCPDVPINEDEFSEDVLNVLDSAKKLFQYDSSRRQATSIVMLAVIGSEFQKDIGPLIPSKADNLANGNGQKNVSFTQSNSSNISPYGPLFTSTFANHPVFPYVILFRPFFSYAGIKNSSCFPFPP